MFKMNVRLLVICFYVSFGIGSGFHNFPENAKWIKCACNAGSVFKQRLLIYITKNIADTADNDLRKCLFDHNRTILTNIRTTYAKIKVISRIRGAAYLILGKTSEDVVDVFDEMEQLRWLSMSDGESVLVVTVDEGPSNVGHILEKALKMGTARTTVMTKDLNFYSWKPFQRVNDCGAHARVVTKMSSCNSRRTLFAAPELFFREKVNFNGCPIKVATVDIPPFVIPSGNPYPPGIQRGLEPALLEVICSRLNLTVHYVKHGFGHEWGEKIYGKWTNVFGLLERGEADMMLSASSPGFRSAEQDFKRLQYTFANFMTWYLPNLNSDTGAGIPPFREPYGMFVLVGLCMISSYTASVMSILSREQNQYKSCLSCLCTIAELILGLPVRTTPRFLPARIHFVSWGISALLIGSIYRAFLSGWLSSPPIQRGIQSEEELISSKLLVSWAQTLDDIFLVQDSERPDPIFRALLDRRIDCGNTSNCIQRLSKERDLAFAGANATIFYYASTGNLSRDSYYRSIESLLTYNVAPLANRRCPFIRFIDDVQINAVAVGIASKLGRQLRAWLDVMMLKNTKPSGFRIVTMQNMSLTFIVYICGCLIAVICFVVEMVYYYKF